MINRVFRNVLWVWSCLCVIWWERAKLVINMFKYACGLKYRNCELSWKSPVISDDFIGIYGANTSGILEQFLLILLLQNIPELHIWVFKYIYIEKNGSTNVHVSLCKVWRKWRKGHPPLQMVKLNSEKLGT